MSLNFFEGSVSSPSGAPDGVFIPVGDIPGVESGEFASGDSEEKKQAKAILGLVLGLNKNIPSDAIGLSAARTTTSPGLDLTTHTLTVTPIIIANHSSKSVEPIPLPSSGANQDKGGVTVQDVFPNATKISADSSISGEGVVIGTSNLQPYGSPAHGSLDPATDSRMWWLGLAQWLADSSQITLRDGSTASAITARARGGTTAATLPANATASTDPTTDLSSTDLNQISVVSHTLSISVETKDDPTAQTFDVNVVTA